MNGEWWTDTPVDREEWDIQLQTGALHRLSRSGKTWLLEGAYG